MRTQITRPNLIREKWMRLVGGGGYEGIDALEAARTAGIALAP